MIGSKFNQIIRKELHGLELARACIISLDINLNCNFKYLLLTPAAPSSFNYRNWKAKL
jgi:hypothetical protein